MILEKNYIIESLEKKLSDKVYYFSTKKENKEKVINETSNLLNQLKNISLEKSEKKIFFKALSFLKELKGNIR